jgi:hypothetical protein
VEFLENFEEIIHSKMEELANEISKQSSIEGILNKINLLFSEIDRSTILEEPSMYRSIKIISKNPIIVDALIRHYKKLDKNAYYERKLTVQVVGELQRPESLDFLKSVVWEPLPFQTATEDDFSLRDLEEIIQTKAVQGIAYLKSENALNETIKVIINHKAMSVKAAAIDSYMWNLNDSKEAAGNLYKILPIELHHKIERPRFHLKMDPREFNDKLKIWLGRWGKNKKK